LLKVASLNQCVNYLTYLNLKKIFCLSNGNGLYIQPAFFILAFLTFLFLKPVLSTAEMADENSDSPEAVPVRVESVLIKGNRRIETDAILVVIRTKKGDILDYGILDKDLRDIYKMGYFKDVQIETADGTSGKIVIFRVIEKPSIDKIVFEGNKKEGEDKLKKELGIDLYSILDNNEVKQSVNRLKDYYRQKGYYNAEIKDVIELLDNNEVLLKYKITENEKVCISKIQFLGNKRFDDDDLKDIMETSEKGFFSWITNSGYLEKKKLEFDVHKITSFYQNHGYIKAKIGKPKITYVKDKGLTIIIEIDEGPQYGVRTVSVEGELIKPADELLEKVQIKNEKVFNRETVRKDIQTLRSIYGNEGYAYANVDPITKEDNENHLIDIAFVITKGQKVRFERINIFGNTITRDKVIRRELLVIEDDYYNGAALKYSTQNLNRLGFFEDVQIQKRKGSADDLMILDVNVKERPTGSFSFGAGYSSVDDLFGTVQLSQKNLFGRGQQVKAQARIGGTSSLFDIRFIEPWVLDKPVSLDSRIYKWEYEYDDYTKDSFGASLGVGFLVGIDIFTRAYITYSYDDADITDIDDYVSRYIRDMEGRNKTSSMVFEIRRDSRDKPWDTSRGSVNSFSFEYAGGLLGGDIDFNKYFAKSAWYFPLFWKTVILVQGRWGYIEARDDGHIPVYQKFTLGGINTVRGFEYGDISPIDPEYGDKIGGEKMMCYNLEYRFPVLKKQGLVGLVFFDAGNVFEKDESWGFSGIRKSAGLGIRWYSPMGPLRLEYGKNLDPRDDEESGKWEFSVGGAF